MKHKLKNIYKFLHDIECSIPVEQLNIFGVDAWIYIRIKMVKEMHSKEKGQNQNSSHFDRVFKKIMWLPTGLYKLFLIFILDYKNNDIRNENRDILFLTNSSSKRLNLDSGWYDVFVDPIVDYLEQQDISYKIFETSQMLDFKYPRKTKSNLIFIKMMWIYFKSLITSPFKKSSGSFDNAFEQYKTFLKKRDFKEF